MSTFLCCRNVAATAKSLFCVFWTCSSCGVKMEGKEFSWPNFLEIASLLCQLSCHQVLHNLTSHSEHFVNEKKDTSRNLKNKSANCMCLRRTSNPYNLRTILCESTSSIFNHASSNHKEICLHHHQMSTYITQGQVQHSKRRRPRDIMSLLDLLQLP